MIRLLPFILIPLIVFGGLWYFRYVASKPSLPSPTGSVTSSTAQDQTPIEVPKTLPAASLDDRVKSLENLISKIIAQVNVLKSSNPNTDTLDASVTELRARVSALEKATPAPVTTTGQSTVYIPLGSGGGPWGNQEWFSTSEYQISLDPANYPGYSGMVLEVAFKMSEAAGMGSIRLYNLTDSSAVSGQVDNTTASLALKTTGSFKLATGTKTYALQVKSSQGKDIFIQSARIKVSF